VYQVNGNQITSRLEKRELDESNSKISSQHRNDIDYHWAFVAVRHTTDPETWPTTWRYNHRASEY
jgi:hypothetical protein